MALRLVWRGSTPRPECRPLSPRPARTPGSTPPDIPPWPAPPEDARSPVLSQALSAIDCRNPTPNRPVKRVMNLHRLAWSLLLSCSWLSAQEPAQAPAVQKDVMVAFKDGTKLATDVYLPASSGKFPVILSR